jgi:hypothetical protein
MQKGSQGRMMKKHVLFLLAAAMLCGATVRAEVLNEWTFETDSAGKTLSQAVNSGSDAVAFSTDVSLVTQTDGTGGLVCSNEIAGIGNLWTNGAILRADVTNQSSGVRFLRYDLDYDMTATENNSGTLLGLAFADAASTNLAGVALKCTTADSVKTPPTGISAMSVTNLTLTGRLAVIVQLDLDNHKMSVWYDLSGANSFNASNDPNATVTNLTLTSIQQLEFRATGDFIDNPSNKCVVVKNIRTASTWGEITNPFADYSKPPVLTITHFTDELSGAMEVGMTNVLTVVIKNTLSPATNVTSTLTHDGNPGDFTIISNNTGVVLGPNETVTNTYTVVAHTEGSYGFTAQAKSTQAVSALATLPLAVGRRISFDSYVITNESGTGNLFPGEAEPGETFDLTITSINDGAVTLTGITNSLTPANSSYFTPIIPLTSPIYPSFAVGSTTSTTYQVTCSGSTPNGLQPFTVINRTAHNAWTNQFSLYVRRESQLTVSTNALTITVAPGEKASATLTLSSTGNEAVTYTFADVGNWAGQYYTVSTQTASMIRFDPIFDELDTNTTFTSWGTYGTTTLPIGFSFPLMGTPYANFFVSCYGAVSFSAEVGASTTATLPSGTAALAAPFWGTTSIDTNSIRYSKADTNKLVVAWGNRTGAEFQAWLYPDGRIRYLYDQTTWTNGAIGVQQSGTLYQNVAYQPGSGSESVLLTPVNWVTHTPTNGTLVAGDSAVITYTADATGKSVGKTVLTNTVSMGGTTLPITVTVNVVAATNLLTVTPSPVTFFCQAGSLTNTTMTVSNAGNTTLNYTITDTGAQAAGYSWTNVNDTFSWDTAHFDANSHDAVPLLNNGDDKTDWIPFGFNFPFYGTVYTAFKIDANGGIVLNSSGAIAREYDRVISAYFSVSLDDNATLRYSGDENKMVVTWENTYQDVAGPDQTFQLIAYKNGNIKCQYLSVSGTSLWPNAEIYVDNDFNTAGLETVATLKRTGEGDSGTVTYSNNYVVTTNGYVYDTPIVVTNTTVVTNYISVVEKEAILFYPSNRIVIVASPVSGTLAPGASAPITIYGDARSLPVGGSIRVTNSTTFLVTGPNFYESLVSSTDNYEWIQSTGHTNEYYLVRTGGLNPYFPKPDSIMINNTVRSEGSVGSLVAPAWGWGNNDSAAINFNTIYVRIATAPTDPDSQAAGYVMRTPASVFVTFTATNSATASYAALAADPVVLASLWGTDESPVVSVQQNANGSHTIWWPTAQDPLPRTYIVQYTTSLSEDWTDIITLENPTTYVYVDDDDVRNAEPVIFYRVMVGP